MPVLVADTPTLSGLLVAVVAMLRSADIGPLFENHIQTTIVQEAPGASRTGQLCACMKYWRSLPFNPMSVIEKDVVPLLERVTERRGLGDMRTKPKSSLVGLTDAAGFSVSRFDLVIAFAVAVIETELICRTG